MDLPEVRFQGLAFRAHDPRWAWDTESGEGARIHGGRFNPVGTPALYLSLSFETAWAEAQQGFAFKPQPLTLCAYEIDCSRLVDLHSAEARDAAQVTLDDLGCAWEDLVSRSIEPPTHALTARLMGAGIAGILVPSFAPEAPSEATNLVLWTWSRNLPHRVRHIDEQGRLISQDPPKTLR